MTKDEFYEIIKKPMHQLIEEKNGIGCHLKHLWDENNAKSIFAITGLDFSEMLKYKTIR